MALTTLLLISVIITQSSLAVIRSMYLTIAVDSQFQCNNSNCVPLISVTLPNLMSCQLACLAELQCLTATFDKLTGQCELFVDSVNENGALTTQIGIVTMTAVDRTRVASVVEPATGATLAITAVTSQQATSVPTTSSCLNTEVFPSGQAPTIGWLFQNNLQDHFGVYNGTGHNNPTYGLGRHSCGRCLNLTNALLQYVTVGVTPYYDLRPISFSIESWIKPTIVGDGIEHVIFGQCPALAYRQCMRTSISGPGPISFLFRSDTAQANRNLSIDVWSHVAYVYNLTAQSMSLYYNGTLDASSAGHGPFQGVPSPLEIGNVAAYYPTANISFSGCIDEIWFYPFARTASDISATAALG